MNISDIREDIAEYADRSLQIIQEQRKRGVLNQDFFLAFIRLFPSRLKDLQVTEQTIRKLIVNRYDAKTIDSYLKISSILQRFDPTSLFWNNSDFLRIEQELDTYRQAKKWRPWMETTAILFRLFHLPTNDPESWKDRMKTAHPSVYPEQQEKLLHMGKKNIADQNMQRAIQQALAHRKQTDATWLQSPEVLHTLANIHTIYPHIPEAQISTEEYTILINTIRQQLRKRSTHLFIQNIYRAHDVYFCTVSTE